MKPNCNWPNPTVDQPISPANQPRQTPPTNPNAQDDRPREPPHSKGFVARAGNENRDQPHPWARNEWPELPMTSAPHYSNRPDDAGQKHQRVPVQLDKLAPRPHSAGIAPKSRPESLREFGATVLTVHILQAPGLVRHDRPMPGISGDSRRRLKPDRS